MVRGKHIFGLLILCCVAGCGKRSPSPERTAANVDEVVVASSNQDSPANDVIEAPPTPSEPRTEASPAVVPQPADAPSKAYRMAKIRMAPDDALLAQHGLRKIESQRLVLVTDSPDRELDQLPVLANQLFDALQAWFGKLPEAADGSDFQVLGHIMVDRTKFRNAGLLPDESFSIRHGRHLRYAFWTGYPDTAYYRRHLALHEFVHCFMMCEHQDLDVPPPWYIEGMAELFGTHSLATGDGDPKAIFDVMPSAPTGFEGWGRIRAFRERFLDSDHKLLPTVDIPTWDEVVPDRVAVFESPLQYSASWAVCWFLKHHPDVPSLMPTLAKERTYAGFIPTWERQINDFGSRLPIDWLLFSEQLDFGFDAENAFPVHRRVEADSSDTLGSEPMPLYANLGWQDSGVRLQQTERLQITCEGLCVVNETSEPWESTPDGISIEYYRGNKLGQVVAVVVSPGGKQITDRIPIGRAGTVTANFAGRVWLQVNDSCASRANNSGEYKVRMERLP